MWLKRETRRQEIIDAHPEKISYEEYGMAFEAVAWSNRNLGGTAAVLRPLARLARERRLLSFTILDVGCGGGDIDEAIIEWARREHLGVTVLGIDNHAHAVRLAKERLSRYPETGVMHMDFFESKFSEGSFDFVIATMVLHHLPDDVIPHFLWSAYRIARVGVVIVDLRRSLPAYWVSRTIVPRLAPKSAIFAHDAPLSFQRAFTLKEAREVIARARVPYMVCVPWQSPFRIVWTAERLADGVTPR